MCECEPRVRTANPDFWAIGSKMARLCPPHTHHCGVGPVPLLGDGEAAALTHAAASGGGKESPPLTCADHQQRRYAVHRQMILGFRRSSRSRWSCSWSRSCRWRSSMLCAIGLMRSINARVGARASCHASAASLGSG